MKEKQRKLLEELRSSLVAQKNTMPYCIYTDELIEALLQAQPKTMEQLTSIKGFPKDGKRVKGFGESILKIFTDTDKITSFKIDANSNSIQVQLRRMNSFG